VGNEKKPPPLSPVAQEIGTVAANFALGFARPFYWHRGALNENRNMRGGTAFVLKFGERYIGVTANHVMEEYLAAKREDSNLICQMQMGRVEPEKNIIAQSEALDLATFSINPILVPTFHGETMDCTGKWPPPAVKRGDALSAAGYPENLRSEIEQGHFEFGAWGALCIADDVTERSILTIYDPKQIAMSPKWALLKPPLGINLSGCSGGPVILHHAVGRIQMFSPVGIIVTGPTGVAPEQPESDDRAKLGELASDDRIFFRRLDLMREDGTLKEPNMGWTPPPSRVF